MDIEIEYSHTDRFYHDLEYENDTTSCMRITIAPSMASSIPLSIQTAKHRAKHKAEHSVEHNAQHTNCQA